jgi:hypothetical protein
MKYRRGGLPALTELTQKSDGAPFYFADFPFTPLYRIRTLKALSSQQALPTVIAMPLA